MLPWPVSREGVPLAASSRYHPCREANTSDSLPVKRLFTVLLDEITVLKRIVGLSEVTDRSAQPCEV